MLWHSKAQTETSTVKFTFVEVVICPFLPNVSKHGFLVPNESMQPGFAQSGGKHSLIYQHCLVYFVIVCALCLWYGLTEFLLITAVWEITS